MIDTSEYVSNCCDCPMDKDILMCPSCKEGCVAVAVEDLDE